MKCFFAFFIGLGLTSMVLAGDAKPPHERVKAELPDGAIAYHFNGGTPFPGFKTVRPSNEWKDGEEFGWVDPKEHDFEVSGNARYWPYGLMENYLWTSQWLKRVLEFRAKVPNGEYLAWMIAGPLVRNDIVNPHYVLTLNDTVIRDDNCTPEQFNSEKYLFRFLHTQYSEKPHFIYDAYISKMFPIFTTRVKVTDGLLTMKVQNHILGALILIPVEKKDDFARMDAALRKMCQDDFESRVTLPPQTKPKKGARDGDFFLYVPQSADEAMPWSAPSTDKIAPPSLEAAGVPGESAVMRLSVVPFADLGVSVLELSDLTGPGTISATAIEGFFKNWSVSGIDPKGKLGSLALSGDEQQLAEIKDVALIPGLALEMEKGITQSYWLRMRIPADAKAGVYTGVFTFKPGIGAPVKVPVKLEVYPFKLEADLPLSLGLYGVGFDPPQVDAATRARLLKERLEILRDAGMTGVELPMPKLKALANDTCELNFDAMEGVLAAVKEVGLSKLPTQTSMVADFFCLGRAIGAKLGAPVDKNPSDALELKQPGFEKYFLDGTAQYKARLDKAGVPAVLIAVDEPREGKSVNPWNRTYDATVQYLDLMHKTKGVLAGVDPMGDTGGGKDYLGFLDHADVLSTHAWAKSKRFMAETLAKGKTLWIYNVGMDRFTWGFYMWHRKVQGHWEWSFSFPSADGGWEYYPGNDWYMPYTGSHGHGPCAPYTQYKGGMLYRCGFLTAMEGIEDYRYLYTLEQAVKAAKAAGSMSATVGEAERFLKNIDAKMPEFPKVKGLSSGAELGEALADEAAQSTGLWRKQIAEYLKVLKK